MRIQALSAHRNLGRLLSAAFLLIVLTGALHAAIPAVTAPTPSPQTVLAGATVSFSVTASGTGPFTYFWQYSNGGAFGTLANGGRIAGATSATLQITNSQTSDTGNYRCLVSNASGQSNSGPGSLTVNLPPPPTVTSPGNQTVIQGNTASFSVTASGTGPFTYAWQYSNGGTFTTLSNGGRISGAAAATLQITSTQASDAGSYRCLVSNAGGQSNSGPGVLTVNLPPPPTVTAPGNQTVILGGTASFSVTASGTGPFTYAWQYSNGGAFITLSNTTRITGAATAALQITNVQTSDAGSYRCLVSNAGGQSNSGPGVLTVNLPPPPTVTAPSNQTVFVGNTASFTVTASGTGPFTYTWQFLPSGGSIYSTLSNGGRISGAAGATLQITSVQTSDAGSYRCLVSNAGGQSNSGPATLTIPPPPTVTSPSNQTVFVGATASFSVTASGTGPFTYAWQYLATGGSVYSTLTNGGRISGATGATLQITNAQTSDAGSYRCLVSNANGQTNSGPATLTVNIPPPPTVTTPSNQTVTQGSNASFSVTASGTGPFTYAWQFLATGGSVYSTLANGGRISGATTATLLITGALTADAGSYRCLVSNAGGQVNSGPATLTVNVPPPPTVTQPVNQTVFVGDAATFAVTASGPGPFTYAWQYSNGGAFATLVDGGRISGAATATLQIANAQTTDAGSYRCLVSNTNGQSNSGPATLTVNVPAAPTVTQPVNQTVYVGDPASFAVVASGHGPFTYAWQYSNGGAFVTLSDGGRISGSATATLSVANAQTSDAGSYRCLVSNTGGQSNSGPATLTVNVPTAPVVTQPSGQSVGIGSTATFSVTASGKGPFTYAWQFLANGASVFSTLSDGGRISGAASPTLQIASVQLSDTGNYRCLVSNAIGQSNSGPATLTVGTPDFSLASTPTSRTVTQGQSTTFNISLSDHFGFSSNVALSLSGLPAGATYNFVPASVAAGGGSTLNVFTDISTPVGNSTLTLTATGGGMTHTLSLALHVQAGQPATLDVTLSPSQQSVFPGGSATATVSTLVSGTSSNVGLAVSGLPAGVTGSFDNTSVAAGGSAQLTLNVSAGAATGSFTYTVTASIGGLTATADGTLMVQAAQAPGAPTLGAIGPDSLISGHVVVVTVLGSNLQGATVDIPTAQVDPQNPEDRVFPTAAIQSVSADGSSMEVAIDASDSRTLDFYNLQVSNSAGSAVKQFRVLPPGPIVDLKSPSNPQAGQFYVLSLIGQHLRNTTVSTNAPGLSISNVDTSQDDRINGFLQVSPNAPAGNATLTVTDQFGQQFSLTITVGAGGNSVALLPIHKVLTGASVSGKVPNVYFQELSMRHPGMTRVAGRGLVVEQAAPEGLRSITADDFSLGVYITYTYTLISYHWQTVVMFDPVTGAIGDAVLHGLGVGDTVLLGSYVFSFYASVDLTIYWNYVLGGGFTFPEFCLSATIAVEVPGLPQSGAYVFSRCAGGGGSGPTSGTASNVGISSDGSCATVTPQLFQDGVDIVEVTQNACCEQPIRVDASGTTFNGTSFRSNFNLANPTAAKTSPKAPCPCPCTASVSNAQSVIRPGDHLNLTATIGNNSDAQCDYDVSFTSSSGVLHVTPGSGSHLQLLGHGAGTSSATVEVSSDQGSDPTTVTVNVSNGRCKQDVQYCIVPTGETSDFFGWSTQPNTDIAAFRAVLSPSSTDFTGRSLTEGEVPGSPHDGCYVPGSALPNFSQHFVTPMTTWTVGQVADKPGLVQNQWGFDSIGFFFDAQTTYPQGGAHLPCSISTTQIMFINCPWGPEKYTTNPFLLNVTSLGTTVKRGNETTHDPATH